MTGGSGWIASGDSGSSRERRVNEGLRRDGGGVAMHIRGWVRMVVGSTELAGPE